MRKRHYDNYYPDSEQYMLVYNEQDIGTLIISKQSEQWTLVDIGILISYQNQGIGTAVIKELIEQFSQHEASVFKLTVLKNSRAVKLYERLGFVAVSDYDVHLVMLIKK